MALKNDPIGEAIADYHKGIRNQELLVHCSHTETDEIPIPYLFRTYKEMPVLEQVALNHCQGKVLDIGAGAGCHSLYLKSKGMDVSSLEISPLAIQTMKEQGLDRLIEGNLYQIDLDKFDTILLLMNGIGLAKNMETLPLLLKKLADSLYPGGQIILDSSDISYMYIDDQGAQWVDLNANYYGELSYQFEYKGKKGDEFQWLFVDPKKLEETANKVGLKFEMIQEGDHYDYLARLTRL